MATFNLYNSEGTSVGTVERPGFFEIPVDPSLIHRYLVWVRSVLRDSISNTKTRGEISGGGKKPWKQKGTGRARTGSSRNPLWRGGGTIFGPSKEHNWHLRMPRTERRKALFSALADKAQHDSIIILDEWNVEQPRTKDFMTLLGKLPNAKDRRILVVQSSYLPALAKSVMNVSTASYRTISRVGLPDLLNNDVILMTKETLHDLDAHFSPQL